MSRCSWKWARGSGEEVLLPGLGADETVVARLASIGLILGGGSHTCLNFCRDAVTEPSDVLAPLS